MTDQGDATGTLSARRDCRRASSLPLAVRRSGGRWFARSALNKEPPWAVVSVMAEPHDAHEERAVRAAVRSLVPPSIARGDWQDVLRRAADMAPERRLASVQWRCRGIRPGVRGRQGS